MDAPLRLTDPRLQARLSAAVDVEGKLPHALDSVSPIGGRRVLLLEASARGRLARSLRASGAHLTTRRDLRLDRLAPASFDLVVLCWRDPLDEDLVPAAAALTPKGQLIVVQAYGHDDVAALVAPPGRVPPAGWNERAGPRPGPGWRIRTLHCWWTFGSLRGARSVLGAAFPDVGPETAAGLRRPRLSFKVGIHHRDLEPATSR